MHNFSSTVSGNIVREDPELRYTPGGTAAVSFTIAVKERQKNAQGQWENGDPSFLNAVGYGRIAEGIAEYLRKGDPVIAAGRMRMRRYTAKDGTERTVWEFL